MLSAKTLTQIQAQVSKKFPEVAACKPKIRPQALPKSAQTKASPETHFLVTYHSRIAMPDGTKMDRQVRVVVDAQGKIIKITTSR